MPFGALGVKKLFDNQEKSAEKAANRGAAAVKASQQPYSEAGNRALKELQVLMGLTPSLQSQALDQNRFRAAQLLAGGDDKAFGEFYLGDIKGLSTSSKTSRRAIAGVTGTDLTNKKINDIAKYKKDLMESGLVDRIKRGELPMEGGDISGLSLTGEKLVSSQDAIQAKLESTPGFQFARDQALQASTRALAARGYAGSGNLAIELQNRASGLASSTYQQNIANLMALTGQGQGASAAIGEAELGRQAAIAAAKPNYLGMVTSLGGAVAGGAFGGPAGAKAGASAGGALGGTSIGGYDPTSALFSRNNNVA